MSPTARTDNIEGMRSPHLMAVLLLVAPATATARSSGGAPILAACRAACEAQNMRASCAWLTRDARRCLRRALQACARDVRGGLPAACRPSPDLPACLTHHSCPFGARCVDATCQVVPCTMCSGLEQCQGDKCVVADCAASTENCPAGLHCQPADGPLGSVSGTCAADDPAVRYCTTGADCITPGTFGLICVRGRCVQRKRKGAGHRRTTTTSSTTTTTFAGPTTTAAAACGDVFDCPAANSACCAGRCRPDPYAGKGVCSTLYTPACRLCTTDNDCGCNGIFCDSCSGTASLSGCVNPCVP